MGEMRLRFAAALLGSLSTLTVVLAAPVALNLGLQPDSASAFPGGGLEVLVRDGGVPVVGLNVTAEAADGSWSTGCTTDAGGACTLFPLPGTKGSVTAANVTRDFFIPEGRDETWDLDLADEDDGAPIGLGPRDALPLAFVLVANLFGIAAAIALWRRTAFRLALVGVGLTFLANLLVFLQVIGLAVSAFAGYALVKDARYFGAVPLDDADRDEEE